MTCSGNFLQLVNIFFISVTLLLSHSNKSGRESKELQLQNIKLILVTFPVFHLDISGKIDN